MSQSMFDVFSDDDDEEVTQPIIRKRLNQSDDVREPKKPHWAIDQDKDTKVTEETEQIVAKEYQTGSTSLLKDSTDQPEKQLVVEHSVRHQVALPTNYEYVPLANHVPSKDPARTYPFTLDPFQRMAVHAIERNESVLVSAHTSAGKTVVAEYAIATALKLKQRVIYTSPIKALSNQKYRDLLAEFGDVGLMTGDVSINPEATCLVMTTEILRSMLYRGSEVMREVSWVVFDEIHYMRDKVRGVVWEETLILLPDKVRFVFLSATIPNAMQFAEWICKIKHQPCHVVFTNYRPTPLQHYLFPQHGDGIHLVVDEKSNFREDNFQKAVGSLTDSNEDGVKGTEVIVKWPKERKNYHPVIVFSFSKKECENNALLLSKLDFNTDDEKELVKSIYTNAIQSLSEDDRTLPQIEHLLPLLQRGIGIHHSGLLPILKEVIEIMFQENLLKVLFATETFSIGLNMPAKTVVFTSSRKFDGKEQRWLTGGEYIQMSGRAGRRGLDDRGIVILMVDQQMEPTVAKGMLKGVSDSLDSAFHLTYTMILNLSRVDGVTPEFMLEHSFHQYQNTAKLPALAKDIAIFEKRLQELEIEQEESVGDYYQICSQLDAFKQDARDVMNAPAYCLPFLQPGRLVKINEPKKVDREEMKFGWGIIINFQKTFKKSKGNEVEPVTEGPTYVLDVLLMCKAGLAKSGKPEPCPADESGEMLVVGCSLSSIDGLSTVRVKTPTEVKSAESRNQLSKVLKEVQKRFNATGIPLLDPIKDMRITDASFKSLQQKLSVLEKRKVEHPLYSDPKLPDLYNLYQIKVDLETKIKDINKSITQAESILQMDELKCRRRLLRRLNYTSESDVVEVKGRVACEISAGDELLITEMIFEGVFNDLTPEQTVALLSCLTFGERTSKMAESIQKPELSKPLQALKTTAKRIAKVANECKIQIDEEEYLNSFPPDLMGVVYAWALGAKFSQICKMTEVFEGEIIRGMRRLEELLRQLANASKAIGNTEMETKFVDGIKSIKRDIIFANSLYL
ncbi:ATP-dependent RNA helicase mtr4 [Globomyces sp. JEL0801]|nr:ATP-dependent RNA helicase mtr4 [Globomyces sp. JEL0801]